MNSSKLNMKKVALIIATCVLLIAPASLAQVPDLVAQQMCQDGRLVGIRIQVQKPGQYTLIIGNEVCEGRTSAVYR